jgi:diacylglycerol kinase (ATP)
MDLARKAAEEGFEVVVAAGGDGTINEVVNGIIASGAGATLGIVPLGTGNDLSRTLDIPTDPRDALALIHSGERRPLDTFVVETSNGPIYGINAAAGGFSGQVGEVLTSELKANWGPLAYLIGAASLIPDIQGYKTYISYDAGVPEYVNALNIIVANGRTVAGGKRVSPLSNPEDGLLDVVIVKKGSVVELGDVAARLVAGNLLSSPIITHRLARSIRVESEPGMWFNVDGELITREPVTISVRAASLDVVVGTDYRAVIEP